MLVNIISNNDDNIKDNDIELLFNELNGLNNSKDEFLDLDNINIKNKKDYLKDNKKMHLYQNQILILKVMMSANLMKINLLVRVKMKLMIIVKI